MTTPAPTTTSPEQAAPADRLRIDFLFLDLEVCTRCRGADRNLQSALRAVRDLLAMGGVEVEVNRIHVESAEQARRLRFESSPTIRVNGRDVALELRESSCGSEACTDGCGDSITCRVWVHRGREHTEPPVAMIVEAIMREVDAASGADRELAGHPGTDPDGPFELPENLERFFADRAEARADAQVGDTAAAEAGCCPPAEQRSCCEPEDKAECCGASTGQSCGCR
jgi:hypothetical protein